MIQLLKKILGIQSVDYLSLLEEGAIIVDVRTSLECKHGKIEKSENIPLDSLSAKIKKLKKTNKVIIFCCASGIRSSQACSMAKAKGIHAFNGGSWKELKRKLN